jgi:hypothetical protein
MEKKGISRQVSSSSSVIVSSKRHAWRESVILGRASGLVRNRAAYLRAAMPAFVADEIEEIGNYLVSRLVEYIDSNHPKIEGMRLFVTEAAEANDLPLTDDFTERIIEASYFKWKAVVIASGAREFIGTET